MIRDLEGLRIAVIGINYAPETTGIGPYTTDLCEALVDAGANVDAVVGLPHYPQWRVAPGFRALRSGVEARNGVTLHRLRHFVPGRQDPVRRGWYELTFFARARRRTRRLRPDAVLAVSPSLGAIPAGLALARKHQVKLGVIVQDLMGQSAAQSGTRGGGLVAGIVRSAEGRWLRQADQIGAISEAFIDPLERLGVARDAIHLVPNYSRISPSKLTTTEARERLGWTGWEFLVSHTGNMGYKQDLSNVVAAARLAERRLPDVHFLIIGHGALRSQLEMEAAGLGNLQFMDPLSEDAYPIALAASDILLVNERQSVLDMSLPSKLTSYLAARRPIIAATHPSGATAAVVRQSGAGTVVDAGSPTRLVEAIEELRNSAEMRSRQGARGADYAQAELGQAAGRERLINFTASLASQPNASE